MVNKKLKIAMRVVLDIDDYRKRRSDSMTQMAQQLGEKAKRTGHSLTIGPFNAHDRRIIHVTLKEDPSLKNGEPWGRGAKENQDYPNEERGIKNRTPLK